MARFAFIVVMLVAGLDVQARDCEAWRVFAYDMQLGAQKREWSLYQNFDPKDQFEQDVKNAVYQYPKYFGEEYQERAALLFARDVYYDCRNRY